MFIHSRKGNAGQTRVTNTPMSILVNWKGIIGVYNGIMGKGLSTRGRGNSIATASTKILGYY